MTSLEVTINFDPNDLEYKGHKNSWLCIRKKESSQKRLAKLDLNKFSFFSFAKPVGKILFHNLAVNGKNE